MQSGGNGREGQEGQEGQKSRLLLIRPNIHTDVRTESFSTMGHQPTIMKEIV